MRTKEKERILMDINARLVDIMKEYAKMNSKLNKIEQTIAAKDEQNKKK